jgi:hypothetical protein
MPLIKHPHKKLAPKVSHVSQPPYVGANDIPDPPLITVALCQFLKELPPPFREQLLVRLFAFFKVEIAFFYADLPPDEILEVVGEPPGYYEKFQRAVLLVGALDYIFSEDVPWPPHVDEELMTAAGMDPNQSTNPIRHEPYLEARAKWKKLRSVYSDTALRKLEQALVKFLEQC